MPLTGARVLVISEAALGSHKAHAINTVKTAGGFACLGCEVLVLMRPGVCGASRALASYGESGRLEVRCYDGPAYPEDWRDVASWSEGYARWACAQATRFGPDMVYARSYVAPVRLAERGFMVSAETHAYRGVENPNLDRLLVGAGPGGPVRSIITIHEVLAEDYAERGAERERVCVVPDGVDLRMFGDGVPRADLGCGPNAVYTGSLAPHKGVADAVRAVELLGDLGVTLHVFGGDDTEIEALRREARERVVVHGRIPFCDTPSVLQASDVLLLPNRSSEPSASWTSPVKLGEYLASGRPVVASAIGGIRRWVDEPAVRWHTPDDPGSIADAIRASLAESAGERSSRARAAGECACRLSYANRAHAIWRSCLGEAAGAGGQCVA
ncbi:MAG: hypothetical protein Tsb0013_17200 [Phycisphaerales bacterium]